MKFQNKTWSDLTIGGRVCLKSGKHWFFRYLRYVSTRSTWFCRLSLRFADQTLVRPAYRECGKCCISI